MDLQNYLERSVVLLLRTKPDNVRVHIHNPLNAALPFYSIVINVTIGNAKYRGSSSFKSLQGAFFKALSELGENIILHTQSITSRSGIAGGFLKSNAIKRAKCELIERDSFLYHYRKGHPFKLMACSIVGVGLFELNSIDGNYKVCLAMDSSYLVSMDSCLVFGMGCADSLNLAAEKALAEYSSMAQSHKILGGCGDEFMAARGINRLADFHHSQSRNKENKLIFANLCGSEKVFDKRSCNSDLWEMRELNSPLKFLNFVQLVHPDLEKLNFGIPEVVDGFYEPVFHPFW